MNPEEFTLQHSNQPQTRLHDGECATRDWPMPPVKPYTPAPRELTLKERWKQNAQRKLGA